LRTINITDGPASSGWIAPSLFDVRRWAARRAAATVVVDHKPLARAKPARMRRVDEMLKRQQIGEAEHAAAVRFQREGDRKAALGGYGKLVSAVLLSDKPAAELADPRVGRRKGTDEAMRRLRAGLELLVEHYATNSSEPEASRETKLMALDRAYAREVADAGRAAPRSMNLEGGWSGRDNFQGLVFLKSARALRKKQPFIIGAVLTVS
jgi:hypothetical protein